MSDAGQRTEEPTPKKLADARRRGQVAQSRDLNQALGLAAALAALVATASHLAGELVALLGRALSVARAPRAGAMTALLGDGAQTAISASLPILGATLLAAVLVALLQTRFAFSLEPLSPKLERLDPIAGLRRMFSARSFVELVKALVKLAVVFAVAYAVLRSHARALGALPEAGRGAALALLLHLASRLAWSVAGAFLGLAVLDALYQRWQHRRELRMTKEEVKEEHKQSEGDPHHRAERQRAHKEIARESMLADVRRAKVVVVNPEHIAVALSYDDDGAEDAAPRVVAKGEEAMAHAIIAAAREAGVPVIRNVALAQVLSRLELGEEIPEALYEAVAEVLRMVARLAEGEGA